MNGRMLYLHTRSPLHTGTGQSVGGIDLPVVREITTNWPYVPGSSLKGVLRAACDPGEDRKSDEQQFFERVFGPPNVRDDDDEDDEEDAAAIEERIRGAGWMIFTDARLLCLPVRSLYGTFAWLTSPLALRRWKRDQIDAGLTCELGIPDHTDTDKILIASNGAAIQQNDNVFLDDLVLNASVDQRAAALASDIGAAVFGSSEWAGEFTARFGIVSDNVFNFLAETGTDIMPRIRIDPKTGVVAKGAFWYEEVIPVETIFCGPLLLQPRGETADAEIEEAYTLVGGALDEVRQVGGHATIGRGLVQFALGEGADGG